MKKFSFLVFMILSAVCLSACNSQSSVKGEFLSKEYVLSLEEVKDFYDELNVQGVPKEKVELISSNENILKSDDGEEFQAISSGNALVFAQYKNKVVASAKVKVNYKLSSPQNFKVSTDGILSWDESYAVINGKKVVAEGYKIEIGQIVSLEEEIVYESQTIEENSITLPDKASYSIKIQALSGKKNLEDSEQIVNTYHYGVMGVLEEIEFKVSDSFSSQEATLSWKEKENAKYDVYVEGFKIASDSTSNAFSFDYSVYQGGKEVRIEIIAKEAIQLSEGRFSTTSSFKLNVLETPDLSYSFDKEGKLVWSNDSKATVYRLKTTNYQGDVVYKDIEDRTNLVEILEGYDENIYDLSLVAVGGENDGYYVSSKPTKTLRVCKIQKPEVEIEFVDNKVKLTFPEDDYVTDYKITYNFKSIYYSTNDGLSTLLDVSDVPEGIHQIEIIALPKADSESETGVAYYPYSMDKSNIVLNSDRIYLSYCILGQIGEISHTLEGNQSTLSFLSVKNANFYHIYVNDERIPEVNVVVNDLVTCTFSNLREKQPKDGGYDIKVIAGATDKVTGKEISTRSERIKRLEILDVPAEVAKQTNGNFAWQRLAEECNFSYEVYKTANDYKILPGQNPVLSETNVDSTTISEVLEEGYYNIKVWSNTTDTNKYLDSNFYDAKNVLDVNFFVTQIIETPEVVFFTSGNDYKLKIKTVDFASLYEVYVDGTIDGQISSVGLEEEEYVFAADFAKVGKHEVRVKALSGENFDETIYKDSEEFVLNVNRLSAPKYKVEKVYTNFNEDNHEWLTVEKTANTTSVKFLLNENEVKGEDYRLDLIDYNTYGSNFKIGLMLIAGEAKENNYYINSHLKEVEFTRAKAPSEIKYSDGKLIWTQNQPNAENNHLFIVVDSAGGSDYFSRLETIKGSATSMNLQLHINVLRSSNLSFDTAFRQANKLQLQMISYMNKEIDAYYLPSFYGSTTKGSNILELSMLEAPVLTFDVDSKVISWDYDIAGAVFDIYVDDILRKEGYSESKSITLQELGDFDFTKQRKITIRARHSEYLQSDLSEPINIKELVTPSSLKISKDGEKYIATMLISNDSTHIESVHINGSSDKVNYTLGANYASFAFEDFIDVTDFSINFIAKNEGDNNYYMSSTAKTFIVDTLEKQDLKAEITGGMINWQLVATDIVGASQNPVRYELVFTNNGKTFTKVFTNETNLELAELEKIAGQALVGEVNITFNALVSLDYSLNVSDNQPAKGYYGKTPSISLVTHKLEQVGNVEINVVDGVGYTTKIDKKINSSLTITFPDLWSSFTDTYFIANVGLPEVPQELIFPETGAEHALYSFAKVGTDYVLTLKPEATKAILTNTVNVTVKVCNSLEIDSDVYKFQVSKLNKTPSAEISEQGIMTINDSQTASYLIEISMESDVIETFLTDSKMLDLIQFIKDKYGAFTIKILSYDENNKILPATEILSLDGYKLQGIENIEITDDGNIVLSIFMDDLSNVVFTVRHEGKIKTFNPKKMQDKQNQYYIPMLDLLQLFSSDTQITEKKYSFEFAIKDAGSVNSDWVPLTFYYGIDKTPLLTRGNVLDKDYIMFELEPGLEDVETLTFRTIVTATFTIIEEDEAGTITTTKQKMKRIYSIPASNVLGYWVTDSEGKNGYFSTEKGSEVDLVYKECYCININELLIDVEYGFAEIQVSRIGKYYDVDEQSDIYCQFNETNFGKDIYKLNRINDSEGMVGSITVKDNYLTFSWTQRDIEPAAARIQPTAYYVVFENENGDFIKRVVTTVCSLDLRTVALTPGANYNIYVKAVSSDNKIIASDLCMGVATLRYTTPVALEVKNGVLAFNEEQFLNTDFMKDIIEYFAQTTEENSYHNSIGNSQYTAPFFFSPVLLDDLYVTLQFTRLDAAGGVTGQVYNITINGYWLFPDITIDFNLPLYSEIGKENKKSYYTLLEEYMANNLEGNSTAEALNTKSMIEALLTSPRGIGNNMMLFDDIGRKIPGGDYLVNLIQTKSNQYIESENGEAVKMYLTPSPEILLKTVTENNLSQYMVDVTPVLTKVNDGSGVYHTDVAKRYKLLLRPTEEGVYGAEFIIQYNGDWTIAYNGVVLDNVISNNGSILNGVPGFTINMSKLRRAVNDYTGYETVVANTLMRADLFAFAEDNGYVINGKSAVFNAQYLDLSADSIKFNGGKFMVEVDLDNSYELLVKYKLTSAAQNYFTTKFTNGVANLQFDDPGVYEYIILSLNGSISSNTMNIESASYAITNLYKLSAPTLSTSNLNLIISYTSNDLLYMDKLEFNMANDVSLRSSYSAEDSGYYYTSYIASTDILAPYVVGSKNLDGSTKYPSELKANSFYAYLNGNSGAFTLSDQTHAMADYLMVFSEEWAVMTSDTSSINARMLANIDSYQISEGNLLINDIYTDTNIVSDKDGNVGSGTLVYEIIVTYYIEDNDVAGNSIYCGEEIFYSEKLPTQDGETLAQVFDGLNFNSHYDYFTVAVTLLGALKVDEDTREALQTVEGGYILLVDTVYYMEDGAQVLRSQTHKLQAYNELYLREPYRIWRTVKPYLESGSNGVASGNINFVVDKSIYFADASGGDKNIDTPKRIMLYAQYEQAGETKTVRITGKYKFTTSTASGQEDNVYVSFTPDEGQLNDIVGSFNIIIYAYSKDRVLSNSLTIKDVYKLSNIDSRYYQIRLSDGNTVIDFANYFKNVSINNDIKCYKLVVNYKLEDSEDILSYTLTSQYSIQTFVIPANATLLNVQSQDGQEGTESNPKKLLYSDTKHFNLIKTDVAGLAISWNAQTMRFEWAWPDERTDQYEYYVSLTYINGKNTTEIVNTNYYQPKDRGQIATGGFEIKARKVTDNTSEELYTFSETVTYTGEEIRYDLFSGGNGSKTNPYLIRNATDFLNMSKRNTKDFYFKIDANNISISISDLYQTVEGEVVFFMQDFNANLDGNGYNIEIVSNETILLNTTFTPNLIGTRELEFTEYSSLFKTINAQAEIKNLFIDYVIDYDDLNNTKAMFSPLCAYNYGTIDGVKVSSVKINGLFGKGDANYAFIGGIASVNYGTIKNSINAAAISYTMAQQLNLNFAYAGIALFNANVTSFVGNIENCFNQAAKSVTVTVNNNVIYVAGIALTNSGTISKSGNDGQLTLAARTSVSTMTGYYGGIVVANNNGTLEFVYNNGVIEKTSDYGTFNYGGIAYSMSNGKINTLVVTVSGQPIVKNCTYPPVDSGFNYASSDSGTSTNIATRVLSEQVIDCGNGYSLTIAENKGTYKATITKA